MTSSFWKMTALAGLIGLFYVGHGLHIDGSGEFSSVLSAVHAQEVRAQEALLWETIKVDHSGATWVVATRAKVLGGWLVHTKDEGLVFLPDPQHAWNVAISGG